MSLCPVFPDMEMHQEMSSVEMNFGDEVLLHGQSACAAVKLSWGRERWLCIPSFPQCIWLKNIKYCPHPCMHGRL